MCMAVDETGYHRATCEVDRVAQIIARELGSLADKSNLVVVANDECRVVDDAEFAPLERDVVGDQCTDAGERQHYEPNFATRSFTLITKSWWWNLSKESHVVNVRESLTLSMNSRPSR